MNDRDMAVEYAKNFIGTWYSWGGDDPSGFDCSGFVIEVLKAGNRLPRRFDTTAQGLYGKFVENQIPFFLANRPTLTGGCLIFYGQSKLRISHVEILLDNCHAIGASGGGSRTKTSDDATRDNAFIKIRHFLSRKDLVAIVDPFLAPRVYE